MDSATICASINEEVVHGIPSAKRKLKTAMSLSIDLVSSIDGYHGDSAVTIPIGHVKPDVMKLLKVTEESLFKGIEQGKLVTVLVLSVTLFKRIVRNMVTVSYATSCRSWFRPRNA